MILMKIKRIQEFDTYIAHEQIGNIFLLIIGLLYWYRKWMIEYNFRPVFDIFW